MYIEDDGFSNAYKKMCLYLLKNGEKSCPRNMGTQEVEGAMIRVKNPRTRMGINSLVDWIENECNTGVIETDIFTYPTKNVKELLAIDKQILNKSIEKFWQVLLEFQPDTIILYGSLTVDVLKKLLKDKNKQVEYFCKNEDGIEDIEKIFPFARFNIDSKNINVIVCRHLMYYGKNGNSFENLRQNIKKSLEKDKEIER